MRIRGPNFFLLFEGFFNSEVLLLGNFTVLRFAFKVICSSLFSIKINIFKIAENSLKKKTFSRVNELKIRVNLVKTSDRNSFGRTLCLPKNNFWTDTRNFPN